MLTLPFALCMPTEQNTLRQLKLYLCVCDGNEEDEGKVEDEGGGGDKNLTKKTTASFAVVSRMTRSEQNLPFMST